MGKDAIENLMARTVVGLTEAVMLDISISDRGIALRAGSLKKLPGLIMLELQKALATQLTITCKTFSLNFTHILYLR